MQALNTDIICGPKLEQYIQHQLKLYKEAIQKSNDKIVQIVCSQKIVHPKITQLDN